MLVESGDGKGVTETGKEVEFYLFISHLAQYLLVQY